MITPKKFLTEGILQIKVLDNEWVSEEYDAVYDISDFSYTMHSS